MTLPRYQRQMLLPQIGPAGQERLAQAHLLLIGCGALGTVIADQLGRAGVGFLRIVDRDVVELSNLQRQVLFDEADAREGVPKAVAAAKRLAQINSHIVIEPHVLDVHSGNIESLLDDVQLVLDGTDNVATRYLVNDACVKRNIPWIYGACVASEGRVMPIVPTQGPCLRCIFPQPPGAGELPTCDTAGVLGPAAQGVASLQSTLAIKWLIGAKVAQELTTLDLWLNRFKVISTADSKNPDCPCCGRRQFEFLDHPADTGLSLCGRNAVQVRPGPGITLDLPSVAAKLSAAGKVETSVWLVRCKLIEPTGIELTVFPDGRAIVMGTRDLMQAKSIYARFIGI